MGVTFVSVLRTVLRQDANVIFVDEMRDQESFAIGVRAALSGHLVQSQVALGVAGGAVLGALLLFALVQAHVMHPVVRERMPGTMELAGTVLRGLGQ